MSDYTIDPKDFKTAVRVILLIVLLVVCSKVAPIIWPERQAPPAPVYYQPDPTPYVNEIHVFSHNCIGWTVNC